jgi:DNA adenine methylase
MVRALRHLRRPMLPLRPPRHPAMPGVYAVTTLISPLPYFGAKTAIAPQLVALMPQHRHYVEPFAGSLAVLLAKPPSPMETVNDLDGDLVTFWRVLRDQPKQLARACALTPWSRREFASAHTATYPDDITDLERARRIWVSLTQSRGYVRHGSGWKFGIDRPMRAKDTTLRRIEATARRIRDVNLECLPAVEVVRRYGRSPDVLLYIDPPYLAATRTRLGVYQFEMADPAGHTALADALRDVPAAVMVSGYANPLYDQHLYAGWHRHTIAARTDHDAARRAGGTAARTEVVWSNRPLHAQDSLW